MKTKLFLNDDNIYAFKYEIYDDSNNLVEEGYKLYSKFNDDLVVSDTQKVYLDSVGSYTLDDDGNKVYHELVVVNKNQQRIKDNEYCVVNFVSNNSSKTLDIDINDFDSNGVYKYEDDYLSFEVDVINGIVSWLTKDGVSTVVDFYFSKEIIDNIKKIDYFEEYQSLTDVNNKINDGINKIDLLSNKITDESNNLYTQIVDFINGIYNKIIIDATDIGRNFGSRFYNGDIVLVKGDNTKWFVDKTFVFMNDRGIIKIGVLLKDDLTNPTASQVVDQDLLTKV